MGKSSTTRTAHSRRVAKTVYDSWEAVYRHHKPEDLPWYSPSVHPVLKTVLDRIPPTKGTALDIGCGLGQVARHLASRGWSVTAVDISASAIRLARQLTKSGSSITYRRQNSITLDPSMKFDLVVDYLHLHDIQPADVEHYLSVLTQIANQWVVMGYLCSTGTHPIILPSHYFDGFVTQHSHSEIAASMTTRGFQEAAFDPCTLETAPIDYQIEIITFCRPGGIQTRKEALK